MKRLPIRFLALVAATLVATAGLAFAQDASTTVDATQHDQYGSYLTDAEGNALYLFVNENAESTDPERMTEGVRSNAAPCEGGCLENWPPLEATDVTAGASLDPELLYTADVGGTTMVVYNGWPLYHFANDAAPGDTNGQGLGGDGNMWYLVSPEGTPIEGAGGGAMDGAGDDGAMDGAADDGAAEEGAADDGAAGDGAADDGAAEDGAADDGAMDGAGDDGAADDGAADDGAAEDDAADDDGN